MKLVLIQSDNSLSLVSEGESHPTLVLSPVTTSISFQGLGVQGPPGPPGQAPTDIDLGTFN